MDHVRSLYGRRFLVGGLFCSHFERVFFMKVLYFDTETTGILPRQNEIIQFAAIIEIDGEVKEEINVRSRPLKPENINPEALRVTGLSLDELEKYPHPTEAIKEIKAFFERHIDKFDKKDKFYPAGHNVIFDLDFLQNYFITHADQYGTGSYQNWQALDTRVLANFLCYQGKLSVPNIKLETLCQHFEIPLEAHDAMNDIRATRLLMKKMLAL